MTDEELLQVIEQTAETGATELDLSSNNLTRLPPEIGQLFHLTTLDLRNNQLKSLPSEIGQLANLIDLNLKGNQLTGLPPEMAQLTNLAVLDLKINQLTDLPPEIVQLTNLAVLDIGYNELTVVVPEIAQLISLTEFNIGYNELTVVVPEMAQLTNLTVLNLRANQLTSLPLEIAQLTNLKELDLRDNSLPIPPEILAKTSEPVVILKYYQHYQLGQKQTLNEAKVLLVGQGNVGKTSLVQRLLHDRFNLQENKTEGIDIQRWQVPIDNWNIQLNVWDFGGQEIMHATHQFFLTKRSLYLLVLDTRLGEEENRLDYWLKIIQSFGDDSPVIVVGNKSDQCALDLDCRGLQLKYPSIKAFIETSCKIGQGIERLKTAIVEEVNKLEHVKDELPLSWFEVKKQLEAMDRDYLSYHEYEQLCWKVGIENEQSQQTLIGFLHDLGVVLNFRDDPRLEDTNILNPVWVTNGVYQILNDNALMTQHKGILERGMLDRILDAKRYPRHKQLLIVDMMCKFEDNAVPAI